MDTLPHMFCARCKGILLGDTIKRVIGGKYYHIYCSGKIFEEKLDADIKALAELIKKRDKKYKL